MEDAFKFTAAADPDAKLLYNDFTMTNPEKAQFVADMCIGLKKKRLSNRWSWFPGSLAFRLSKVDELQRALDIFREASLPVHITELDLGILPRPSAEQDADISRNIELAARLNPYTEQVPQRFLINKQVDKRKFSKVLYKNRDIIERVTFWGLSDGPSWLNDWPVKGRTSHPLLFDRDLNPKPAYEAIYNLPSSIAVGKKGRI